MIDFGKYLTADAGVWWGQAAAEPRPLVDALIEQTKRIGPLRVFTGLSWNDQLAVSMPDAELNGVAVVDELSDPGGDDAVGIAGRAQGVLGQRAIGLDRGREAIDGYARGAQGGRHLGVNLRDQHRRVGNGVGDIVDTNAQ